MKGFMIFVHASLMLIDNFGTALRVSVVPFGIMAISTTALMRKAGLDFSPAVDFEVSQQAMQDFMLSDSFWMTAILVVGIWNVTFAWIAVAWHRFILSGERPGLLFPRFRLGAILKYLWKSILILLIVLLVMAFVGIVLHIVSPSYGLMIAVPLNIFILMVVSYRLALVLPGVALGERVGMLDAWSATQGQIGAIILLIIVQVVLSLAFSVPSYLLYEVDPNIDLAYNSAMNWLLTMLAISILTTLYGHYIEGRELDE